MATINGTSGNDNLTGTTGNDTISGLAGNDTVDGGSGWDSILGGDGDDYLNGGTDNQIDTLAGGLGNDTYYLGGAGNYAIDVITEQAGQGTDLVYVYTASAFTLPSNVENLTGWGNQLTGNSLDNVITSDGGVTTMYGGLGNDTLIGSYNVDVLYGEDGNDSLTGGGANDWLVGGAGTDTLVGGDGDDLYFVDSLSDVIVESALNNNSIQDQVLTDLSYTLGTAVENLTLTGTGNINGTGNELNNYLTGNSGANILAGGAGNDTYVVLANDTVVELPGEGIDWLYTNYSLTLADNMESVWLSGIFNYSDWYTNLDAWGNAGDNTLSGNGGSNRLYGLGGNDVLHAFQSNSYAGVTSWTDDSDAGNWLDGGAGDDTMYGALGNDTFIVDSSKDVITDTGTADKDVVYASASFTLSANLNHLYLSGGNLRGVGNFSVNRITGTAGNNWLDSGYSSNDTLQGGAGDDTYVVSGMSVLVDESGALPTVRRVSTGGAGEQISAVAHKAIYSADGGKVLFLAYGAALGMGLSGQYNLFLKDLVTGQLSLVSTNAAGQAVSLENDGWGFSPDGSQVLFVSADSSLSSPGKGDAPYTRDTYLKNLVTGAITEVSTRADGTYEGNNSFEKPVMSADGTRVAFSGWSTLVPGIGYNSQTIFVRDLVTGDLLPGSTDASGQVKSGSILDAALSTDGSKLLFMADSADWVSGDTNNASDIFLKDLQTGTLTRVSVGDHGEEANNSSWNARFLPGDTRILFKSSATNLSAEGPSSTGFYVKDLLTGVVENFRPEHAAGLTGMIGDSVYAPDGSRRYFVTSTPPAAEFTALSGKNVAYAQDMVSGRIEVLSRSLDGDFYGAVSGLVLSPDGTRLLLTGGDPGLVAGDTNNSWDVFEIDLTAPSDAGGIDTVRSAGDYTLSERLENLDLLRLAVSGTGNAKDNVLTGNLAGNYLDGGAGQDILRGHEGNDTYVVDNAGDVIEELGIGQITAYDPDSRLAGIDAPYRAAATADGRYVTRLVDGAGGISNLYLKDLDTGVSQLVDAAADGTPSNQGVGGSTPSVSADGRYVAFMTRSNNLVTGDTNNSYDVFVKDMQTGQIVRASTSTAGGQGTGDSYADGQGLSLDGKRVLFTSSAGNLVPGDTNGSTDVFVKDLETGQLFLASSRVDGTPGNATSQLATLSANGRWVLFQSYADNLVAGETGYVTGEQFIKDLDTGLVERLVGSYYAEFTADRTRVVYSDGSSNLFIKDLATGQQTQLNLDNGGNPVPVADPIFSANGENVLFLATIGGLTQLVRKNLVTGDWALASTDAAGNPARLNGASPTFSTYYGKGYDVSDDGRYVVMNIDADNLAEGVTSGVFLKDLQTGELRQVNRTAVGETDPFGAIDLSADGLTLLFTTSDDNGLYPGAQSLYGDYLRLDLRTTPQDSGSVDEVRSSVSWTLAPELENLVLTGNGAINATGNASANRLTGNDAANILSGGAGNDTYVPGAGDTLVELDGEGTDSVETGVSFTLGDFLENLTLTGTADVDGTGNALNNALTGNDGANRLDGGAGDDTMAGGKGDDSYVVDSALDVVSEMANQGRDTVLSGSFSVDLSGFAHVENGGLTGSLDLNVTGNSGNNRLSGNDGANLLTGLDGNDTLAGGAGDTLVGGLGDDVYETDGGAVIEERAGEGLDTVRSSVSLTLAAELENLELTGTGHIDGTGNALDNRLKGNGAGNVLEGGAGVDTLLGGEGDDVYVLADSADTIVEYETEITPASPYTRISLSHEGGDLNAADANVWISPDGNKVIYSTAATNAAASDANAFTDLFMKDLQTGEIRQLNVTPTGGQPDAGITSFKVSPDGGKVYFTTAATNMVDSSGSGYETLYSVDTATLAISMKAQYSNIYYGNYQPLNGETWAYHYNGYSSYLVYPGGYQTLSGMKFDDMTSTPDGSKLVIRFGRDLMLWDTASGYGWTFYSGAAGTSINDFSISADGGKVTFSTWDGNVVAGDTNGTWDVFTYDTGNYQFSRVSVDSEGNQSPRGGSSAVFSPDGNTVYFSNDSLGGFTSPDNDWFNVYAKNLTTGELTRVTQAPDGSDADSTSYIASGLTNDNRLLIWSQATNLLPGNAPGTWDLLLRDMMPFVPPVGLNGGIDTVRAAFSYTLGEHLENLELTGTDNLNGTGNDLDNRLTGNSGNNVLDGGAGNDTAVYAGSLADYVISGDATSATVSGAAGTDTLLNIENLRIGGVTVSVARAIGNQGPVAADDDNAADAVVESSPNVTGDNTATGNVLANDSDPDAALGDVLTVATVNGAAAGAPAQGVYGSLMLLADGSYTYTLDNADSDTEALSAGQTAVEVFTYSVRDELGVTATASLSITIQGSTDNTAPELAALAGHDYTDTVYNDVFAEAQGVLSGSDADAGDTLTYGVTGGADNGDGTVTASGVLGSLTVNTVTGAYRFTADDLALEALTAATTLDFTVTVSDGAATASRTLSFRVAQDGVTESAGHDLFAGANGTAESFAGLGGDDTYQVDASDSLLEAAGGGTDTVLVDAGTGVYTLGDHLENLVLAGRGGVGTGNGLDNQLSGNSGSNALNGGAGNDRLDGGLGVDTLTGGAGDDTYVIDTASDRVTELAGQGTDLVLSSVSYALAGNVENLTLTGIGSLSGSGNALANVITGNSGVNLLSGGDGHDTLNGGGGSDTLKGDAGNDVLAGGTGNDNVQGGAGDDSYLIARGEGTDTLTDTAGNDVLWFNDASISSEQLWFRQAGSDLEVAVIGSTTKVLVKGWYAGAANQVETIRAGDGKELLATEVQTLVSAMASFATRPAGSTSLTAGEQAALLPVIGANWS